MAGYSAGELFKQAANQIAGQLSAIDTEMFDKAEQRSIRELKRLVGEVRLDIRDFEYADTRAELLAHAAAARTRLALLKDAVLKAAEAGIFGAADVAQLSAQFDAAADKLAVQ